MGVVLSFGGKISARGFASHWEVIENVLIVVHRSFVVNETIGHIF